MLHRCAAVHACCPKLRDDDFGTEAAHHLYNNPYMQEDMLQSGNIDLLGEGAQFPTGALSLMYVPPVDDMDDMSDGESSDDWLQDTEDVNDLMNVPKLISNSPPVAKNAYSLGAGFRKKENTSANVPPMANLGKCNRPPSPTSANADADEGGISKTRSSSLPRLSAPSRPRLSARLANAATATPLGWGVHAKSPSLGQNAKPATAPRSDAKSSNAPAHALLVPPSFATETTTDSGSSDPSSQSESIQASARTEVSTCCGDSSLKDPSACSADVGAASIAAIRQCVAQSQQVPEQQRPNSEKWAKRLAKYDTDKLNIR